MTKAGVVSLSLILVLFSDSLALHLGCFKMACKEWMLGWEGCLEVGKIRAHFPPLVLAPPSLLPPPPSLFFPLYLFPPSLLSGEYFLPTCSQSVPCVVPSVHPGVLLSVRSGLWLLTTQLCGHTLLCEHLGIPGLQACGS